MDYHNYIDDVKQQIIILASASIFLILFHIIECYNGWNEPIILTIQRMRSLLVFSLLFIFLFPIMKRCVAD